MYIIFLDGLLGMLQYIEEGRPEGRPEFGLDFGASDQIRTGNLLGTTELLYH